MAMVSIALFKLPESIHNRKGFRPSYDSDDIWPTTSSYKVGSTKMEEYRFLQGGAPPPVTSWFINFMIFFIVISSINHRIHQLFTVHQRVASYRKRGHHLVWFRLQSLRKKDNELARFFIDGLTIDRISSDLASPDFWWRLETKIHGTSHVRFTSRWLTVIDSRVTQEYLLFSENTHTHYTGASKEI